MLTLVWGAKCFRPRLFGRTATGIAAGTVAPALGPN